MSIYKIDGTQQTQAYSTIQELQAAYDANGNQVFAKGVNYDSYIIVNYCTVSLTPTQGFDIYNGVIFQFMANSSISNRMATINVSNQAIINNNIASTSDHGDSASFSDEFYDDADDYPLLYVTSDTNPAKVYINRVTTTTSQLVKTLSFPIDKTGYYAAAVIDKNIGMLYMVGYSEQNYQTDDGGNNKTVISKWDLSSLTENQDGTFTPAFISSIERPFIYVMQGQQFHDGMIWIASGATNYNGKVYAISPTDGTLLHTVDVNSTVELEGLAFVSDNEMVIGLQGGVYKKVVFSQ